VRKSESGSSDLYPWLSQRFWLISKSCWQRLRYVSSGVILYGDSVTTHVMDHRRSMEAHECCEKLMYVFPASYTLLDEIGTVLYFDLLCILQTAINTSVHFWLLKSSIEYPLGFKNYLRVFWNQRGSSIRMSLSGVLPMDAESLLISTMLGLPSRCDKNPDSHAINFSHEKIDIQNSSKNILKDHPANLGYQPCLQFKVISVMGFSRAFTHAGRRFRPFRWTLS